MSNNRFIVLAFLAAAACLGITLVSAAAAILAMLGIPDLDVAGLMPRSSLVGLTSGVTTFFILMRNTRAVTFTSETISELAKVTWPDREETVRSTSVVVVATVFFALSLAIFDFVWKRVANLFLYT